MWRNRACRNAQVSQANGLRRSGSVQAGVGGALEVRLHAGKQFLLRQCSAAGYRRFRDSRNLLPQRAYLAGAVANQPVEQPNFYYQRRTRQGGGLLLGYLAVLDNLRLA